MQSPIRYVWNQEIALKHYAARDQNLRLYEAINQGNLRAAHLLGCGVAEWIVWRYRDLAPIDDALLRLQAAYAANIDPAGVRDLEYDFDEMPGHDSGDPVGGPLSQTLEALGRLCRRLEIGYIYVAELTVNLAMLARRVVPDRPAFEDWLSRTVQRLGEAYPRRVEYDRETEFHDASAEPPLPRAFLDPAVTIDSAARLEQLRAFLAELDPARNPYLVTEAGSGASVLHLR